MQVQLWDWMDREMRDQTLAGESLFDVNVRTGIVSDVYIYYVRGNRILTFHLWVFQENLLPGDRVFDPLIALLFGGIDRFGSFRGLHAFHKFTFLIFVRVDRWMYSGGGWK